MLVGVPILAMVVTTGVFALAVVWSFFLLSGYLALAIGLFYFPVLFSMRHATKKDDQGLKQASLRLRLRLRHLGSRAHWGAISFSPIRYKKR